MAKSTSYSGTPLAKKLGIKSGFNVWLINEPDYYLSLFDDMPDGVTFHKDLDTPEDLIHFFTSRKETLLALLPQLKGRIKPNGSIWVSWPKKASKVITDVTEDMIRNYALQIGLVDVKVCAIDEIWSGLKLVIPVKNRQ
ncbi:MAG: hypothetical protein JWR67_763 [Mucilaginibacter sp.]|nr:hypothetical protein [Mucilaginibacter sp.]